MKAASVSVLSPLNRTVAVRAERAYTCPDCHKKKIHFIIDTEGGAHCVDCIARTARLVAEKAPRTAPPCALIHSRTGYRVEIDLVTELPTLFLARVAGGAPQVFWKCDWKEAQA